MNAKVLGTLEFPKVLARLADVTAFSASRELALALEPHADRFWVERRQEETAEAVRLLQERPEFSVRGTRDVRLLARKAALGGVLDPSQLLEVAGTLESGHFVGGALAKLDNDAFRVLREHAAQIRPCRDVTAAIGGAISDQGEVRDNARPALGRIRRELRSAHSRLTKRLNSYLTSHRSSLQDAIITSRNDRYVIPVKAEARSQIPGIVHDQSASGATVFVEPLAIVELNNALRTLQLQELAEIERILREVSGIGRRFGRRHHRERQRPGRHRPLPGQGPAGRRAGRQPPHAGCSRSHRAVQARVIRYSRARSCRSVLNWATASPNW